MMFSWIQKQLDLIYIVALYFLSSSPQFFPQLVQDKRFEARETPEYFKYFTDVWSSHVSAQILFSSC